MLKKILIGLIALVVILVVVGLFLPSQVHLERSTTIDAPQSTVFTLVNGMQAFHTWSPWHEKEPDAEVEFSGPEQGVGSKMSWNGKKVGTGTQEITASTPYSRVENHLDFGDQGTAEAYFELKDSDQGTRVVWGFDTEFGYDLAGRYFGLLFDRMIGPDYEKGLANLKARAEALPKADFSDLEVERIEVEPILIAYASTSSAPEAEAIGQAFGEAAGLVSTYMQENELNFAGMPLSIDHTYDENGYVFDVGIPIDRRPETEPGEDSEVKIGETPAGEVFRFTHKGAYAGLEDTFNKIVAYLGAHGYSKDVRSWSQYVNDPGSTPEEELLTHIYFQVAK